MRQFKPSQLQTGSIYPITSSQAITASFALNSGVVFETGSLLTTASFNAFTSSYNTGSFTGSFIGDGSQLTGIVSSKWSGSNPISRQSDVEITGSLNVTGGITGSLHGTASWAENAITASYVTLAQTASYVETAQTASYVLNAISSSFATSASYAATASSADQFNVRTALTASDLIYPTADNGEESFIQTDGNGTLTLQYVKTIYEEIVNGEITNLIKGTPVYVSGSQGAASIVYRADAGNPTKMPVIYISADTLAPNEHGRGIALGLIKGVDTSGYPAGTEIYVDVGGGWTNIRPTGSAIVQTLGYVTKEGNGGQGVILNPGPNNLPNLPSAYVWVGNADSFPTPILTSSLSVASASFATSASYALTASFIDGGFY